MYTKSVSVDKLVTQNYNKTQMSLRKINNILLIVVILVNVYVLSVPILPQILYQIDKSQGKHEQLQALIGKTLTTKTDSSGKTTTVEAPPPPVDTGIKGNQVIIPAMGLDQAIIEDNNVYRALDKGVWRWDLGSTPDQGGNTVLVGHRFTYTKPKGVFYFLDKVHEGDDIGMIWNDKMYLYKVTGTEIVPPSKTSILDPTDEPTLTIYTCTPLWSPKNRLVVTARLDSISE